MSQRVGFASLVALVTALALPLGAQSAGPSPDALRFGSPPRMTDGTTRETMWPAPTAEDWEKPVLVVWQRTFEDAQRVARETGKPILACVNMDGEIASEHFAGIRYRQPDTAALLAPYVCVIGSVYRHTPRDFDVEGRRVPCPRFGGVTCGEHVAMESVLFETVLDGKRIAPRHILIELDGRKTYDVYYSWDTATVFTAYREGAKDRPPPKPRPQGDLPLAQRVASADAEDRAELEATYVRGTREVRRALLESALRLRELDQVDLLRLAIFGLDVDLARLARRALAASTSEGAIELIAEVLKTPLEASERAELLAAAARLAETFPRARTLVALHQGLGERSRFVDVQGWSAAAGGTYGPPNVEARAATAEARPSDGPAQLELAEALLARAHEAGTDTRFAELLRVDAAKAARAAEALGVRGWRLDALLAVSAAAEGAREQALTRAQAAVEGGMPRPGSAEGVDEATAVRVLALFAQARQRAIARAYRARESWPPEWLSDVTSAYAVLARHPLGTDENVADGYDFLRWLGATPRAREMLELGLERFPESWLLHERLRARVLWDEGPSGLLAAYSARLARPDAPPTLAWFAGYAALVAAEQERRDGASARATEAYARALEHYRRDREHNPAHADSVDHYVALAHAGRARIAFEAGALEEALRELLASFASSPSSAATLDGLNISPVDTAKMLLSRLDGEELADAAAELRAALRALDPKLLELPAYEREAPPPLPEER